jgi:hypothetical protein
VSISIIQGQWSEVSITKVFTRVFGYLIVQELEVKNQSTLSSKGGDCLLVKVKCLPCRGNSMIPNYCPLTFYSNWNLQQLASQCVLASRCHWTILGSFFFHLVCKVHIC